MKKKSVAKLYLNREVIAALSNVYAQQLNGGAAMGSNTRYTAIVSGNDSPSMQCTITCEHCLTASPSC